jgi:hypothetical protein
VSGRAIKDNEGAFLPCAALLAWIAILKGRRRWWNMAELEIPPNLMSWGMVVVVRGAVERQRNKLRFALFCSFNLNSYVKHSIQVCKNVEYTKFKLTL